jgi:dihydropteroate synthase
MQEAPRYEDVVARWAHSCGSARRPLEQAGVAAGRIVVDPGFGFGKTFEHNKRLFRALPALASLGYPLLAGVSRKKMIGDFTGARPRIAWPRALPRHCSRRRMEQACCACTT